MLLGDPAIPADYESDRQSENSAVEFARLCIAHHNRVIHFEALIEVAYSFRPIIHGNADDLQALLAVLILEVDEMWNLVPARIAPGRPEIQKNDLAPIG